MVPDFVKSLQAEEARLLAELQRSPVYQRLEVVREALHKLQYAYATVSGVGTMQADATVVNGPVSRRGRQGSMAGTVTSTAMGCSSRPASGLRPEKSSTFCENAASSWIIPNPRPRSPASCPTILGSRTGPMVAALVMDWLPGAKRKLLRLLHQIIPQTM